MLCRLLKIPPNNQKPYTSFIELKKSEFSEVINSILNNSFQNQSIIKISDISDQSVMLMKLPNSKIDREEIDKTLTLKEYLLLKNNEIRMLSKKLLMTQKILLVISHQKAFPLSIKEKYNFTAHVQKRECFSH